MARPGHDTPRPGRRRCPVDLPAVAEAVRAAPGSTGTLAVPMSGFRAPKGTRDLLPPLSSRARLLVQRFAELAEQAGYGQVVPPMFEDLGVFQRLGEATDVVTQGDVRLRRQGRRPGRPAARAHRLASCGPSSSTARRRRGRSGTPGPNFRYERPQKGRYRQFDQVGVEVLGTDDPDVDVEVIALGWRFYEALGLRQVTLEAQHPRRPRRPAALPRGAAGPLRGRPRRAVRAEPRDPRPRTRCGSSTPSGPRTPSVVAARAARSPTSCPTSAAAALRAGAGRPATPRHRLRGRPPARPRPRLLHPHHLRVRRRRRSTPRQNAVGGGGRYDGLVEDLGGPPTPGIGFALGVDRTCWPATPRACSPAPATARRRVRGRRRRRRRTRPCSATSCGAPASAPTGPSTAAA